MDSTLIPECTPSAFWQQFLVYVQPAVYALLSGIALWVASLTRGTYAAVQLTSAELVKISKLVSAMAEHNE